MAKLLFGVGIADARNKLGGHVFSKNRNGAYVRQKVSPSQPRSDKQLIIRASFTSNAKAWGSILTDAQRSGYIALASSNPRSDQFGNPQVLTGLQIYQSINRNLKTIAVARLDDPPADQAVDHLTALTLTATVTGDVLTVAFTPTPLPAGMHLVVTLSPPTSPGKNFVTPFLKIAFADPNDMTTSPLDVFAEWTAIFGPLQAGQKLHCSAYVINENNGAASRPNGASALIGA